LFFTGKCIFRSRTLRSGVTSLLVVVTTVVSLSGQAWLDLGLEDADGVDEVAAGKVVAARLVTLQFW
jgi:hypothetical protein